MIDITMIDQLWLILLGFAAGVLGSMIGLGGGIIVVPVLTFLGFSPTAAASNSLFATLSNAVASTTSYSKQKRIASTLGIKLGLLSVPGTVLGALISTDVTSGLFQMLFGLVLVASAVYIFLRRKLESKEKKLSLQQAGFLAIGSFAGGLVGARLSVEIKEHYLQILVSVVILVAAGKLFLDSIA